MDSANDAESAAFPGYTEWSTARWCCFRNAFAVGPERTPFLGHWEVSACMPTVVCSIITSSYLICMLLIFPEYGASAYVHAALMSVLYFLFTYSYFRVIIDGPGYFPFFWPDEECPGGAEDESSSLLQHQSAYFLPSGIITTCEQSQWAAERERPNRCILSKAARRIVIRPDHFCGWIGSWIGKRNHKFFLLFNFWGLCFIAYFLVMDTLRVIREFSKEMPSLWVMLFLIYLFVALMFMMLTGSFVCSHTYGVLVNQTQWEEWRKCSRDKYSQGWVKNVEDVFGPIRYWYTYLLPVSPWKGYTNEELIENYKTGYEPKPLENNV